MPHTKFQVVFSSDDTVDLQMLIDDELRLTRLDLRDAPFPKSVLGEDDIQNALKAWMLATKGPSRMSWVDIESALLAAGINVDALTARYPVSGLA